MFRRNTTVVEYLLLEKKKEPGDWSPPKGTLRRFGMILFVFLLFNISGLLTGKCENGETCDEDTACRELFEETQFTCSDDIEAFVQYKFYFEVITT